MSLSVCKLEFIKPIIFFWLADISNTIANPRVAKPVS